MKAQLYSSTGEKKSQVELPKFFNRKVREDIVAKYFEASKVAQPYAPFRKAGKQASASGTISHKRHDWKGHYGRGISRIPRKTMWRRGTQFYWIGAEISSTRGGRRAHPPKGIGKEKKMNKNEIKIAFESALASTLSSQFIESRYATLEKAPSPAVLESLPEKTKSLKSTLNIIFPDLQKIIFKNKQIRAGRGTLRNRKYKSNAGVLIITSSKENKTLKGFDVISIPELIIQDLYPLGRLTLFTKEALNELSEREKLKENKK
jgi:large subunit ribosomal protein L4e